MIESIWKQAWEKGRCPNDCGDIIKLKKPIDIVTLLNECALEDWMELGCLGCIVAICPECGFVLTTSASSPRETKSS